MSADGDALMPRSDAGIPEAHAGGDHGPSGANHSVHCCTCAAAWRQYLTSARNLERDRDREHERFGWLIESAEHVVVENKVGDELTAASAFLAKAFNDAAARIPSVGGSAAWKLPGS